MCPQLFALCGAGSSVVDLYVNSGPARIDSVQAPLAFMGRAINVGHGTTGLKLIHRDPGTVEG